MDAATGAANGPMVRFDGVRKRYGPLVVLDDLCLDVAANEKVAIIGPSGSGKTTVLRMLMTLERIDDGVIWVDGEPLTHMERNGKLVPADARMRATLSTPFWRLRRTAPFAKCGRSSLAACSVSRVFTEKSVTSAPAAAAMSEAASTRVVRVSPGLSIVRPFARRASTCGPRPMKVTGAPARESFPPK